MVLFASNAAIYNGRAHDAMQKLDEVVSRLDYLKAVVVFQTVEDHPTKVEDLNVNNKAQALLYSDFLQGAEDLSRPLIFEQLDADHPVYILFSSGTTGSMISSHHLPDIKTNSYQSQNAYVTVL